MRSDGDYCIVTGGSRGIGRAIVESFSESGYRVLIVDVVRPPTVLDHDGYMEMDLARLMHDGVYASERIQEIQSAIDDSRLHALVNNAAVQTVISTSEATLDQWCEGLGVNLLAPAILTRELLPYLRASMGSVINVSSIHARLSKPGFGVYATTKAALSALTRAMCLDVGKEVRINAIEPAAVDTDMLQAGFEDPARLDELRGYQPSGRIAEAKEIADAVVWLAGPEARWINGCCLDMSGGIRHRLHDPE